MQFCTVQVTGAVFGITEMCFVISYGKKMRIDVSLWKPLCEYLPVIRLAAPLGIRASQLRPALCEEVTAACLSLPDLLDCV